MSSVYQDEKKYFKLIDKVREFSVDNFDVKR
jgi:hypothetical protein